MSVTEVGVLHTRYVRVSDRFKAIWTYHQFASGVYKNFLGAPLPYNIDFQKIYERIKAIAGMLTPAQLSDAGASLANAEVALDRSTDTLLRADDGIGPSLVRRFFEKLKRQDENIIQYLIKFYLYADAVEGDRRDKIDFLFTRIGEDSAADGGTLEFRERIIALTSVLRLGEAPQDEVIRLIRAVRSIRDEIQDAAAFEELTERNLLRNARLFKHRIGDLYFHPDILLAVVELNVATKNKFLKLYHQEEERILEDSAKLMEHGSDIERSFGETNPELAGELARFREFKERFDESRAASNLKHDTLTHLKLSMNNILAQLDRGLAGTEAEETTADLPRAFFSDEEQIERIVARFGHDSVLQPFLLRLAGAIDAADFTLDPAALVEAPAIRDLRLEPWEIDSWYKLFQQHPGDEAEEEQDLWIAFIRAAALRTKIDEEATILAATIGAGLSADAEVMMKAKQSLDTAKELDEQFADFLHEAVYSSNPTVMHQLYRSRFRLLRAFSGLWLVYDRGTAARVQSRAE
jgi:hypothetical protein